MRKYFSICLVILIIVTLAMLIGLPRVWKHASRLPTMDGAECLSAVASCRAATGAAAAAAEEAAFLNAACQRYSDPDVCTAAAAAQDSASNLSQSASDSCLYATQVCNEAQWNYYLQ